MSMAGLAGGAARRRRERQLRSFLRHEELSVKMALARALHHSAQPAGPVVGRPEEEVEYGSLNALRGQNTPPPGTHPGVLQEPEVQLEAATVGYVAASTPLLVVASLAGGDEVDATTTRYLLRCALRQRQKEEEKERRRIQREEDEELLRRAAASLSSSSRRKEEEEERRRRIQREEDEELLRRAAASLSSSSGKRRKRKKRRKKKLPKCGLFPPRCGRPCDHRQVPAVQVVHAREGAPASVHLQSGGHSCYACRDVYPQCELCSSSCAVPPPDIGDVGFGSSPFLTRYTPSTSCVCHPSVVVLTLRPQCAVVVFASLCRVVVEVSLLMVLTILLGTV